MNTYRWRKNFTSTYSDQKKIIRGKLALKTKETDWIDTQSPVVILISIQSVFHKEIDGDLKMEALLFTIMDQVKGKVTILLSDQAHLHALSLKYKNDYQQAFRESREATFQLMERYKQLFQKCDVVYWHSFISQDPYYLTAIEIVQDLYANDLSFKKLLLNDANEVYANKKIKFFSQEAFIEKTLEDLLEQCACMLVLANKGYRYQFYTGKPYFSTLYVSPELQWIHVFLTIEKKTFILKDTLASII